MNQTRSCTVSLLDKNRCGPQPSFPRALNKIICPSVPSLLSWCDSCCLPYSVSDASPPRRLSYQPDPLRCVWHFNLAGGRSKPSEARWSSICSFDVCGPSVRTKSSARNICWGSGRRAKHQKAGNIFEFEKEKEKKKTQQKHAELEHQLVMNMNQMKR